MIVTRRGFLKGMLALGMAPAIVRADSLMRVIPLECSLVTTRWDLTAVGEVFSYSKELWPGVQAYWGKAYLGDLVSFKEVTDVTEFVGKDRPLVAPAQNWHPIIGVVVGKDEAGRLLVASDPNTLYNVNRINRQVQDSMALSSAPCIRFSHDAD